MMILTESRRFIPYWLQRPKIAEKQKRHEAALGETYI